MTCLNGSCQCSSTSTQYFDSTQLICLNKTLKGKLCTRNMTCRSDLGLSCVNDTCQCDSRTSYWSSIQTICVDCPSGWTIYEDKCYFFYNNLSTRDDAQSMCESNGSYLVSVRTQADFEMVSGYYTQFTNNTSLWVGARMNITYDFYWRDGYTKMNQTYPNASWWCSGQPNNGLLHGTPCTTNCFNQVGETRMRQDCVRMQKAAGRICLNDWGCTDQHAFLCERE
jgi:hypothetical protein